MRSVEVHTVDHPDDEQLAIEAGLIEPDDAVNPSECINCGMAIGLHYSQPDLRFIPYAIVLDDDDYWFVCLDCGKPVYDPEPA